MTTSNDTVELLSRSQLLSWLTNYRSDHTWRNSLYHLEYLVLLNAPLCHGVIKIQLANISLWMHIKVTRRTFHCKQLWFILFHIASIYTLVVLLIRDGDEADLCLTLWLMLVRTLIMVCISLYYAMVLYSVWRLCFYFVSWRYMRGQGVRKVCWLGELESSSLLR